QKDDPTPTEMGDEHWYIWYYNHAARAALGFTPEQYRQAVGTHMLHMAIDPANPHYLRIPDEQREVVFALHAQMFKCYFSGQEFDEWYAQVVSRVCDFPWAAQVWENPELAAAPRVIERQDYTILNPVAGRLHLCFQLNHL